MKINRQSIGYGLYILFFIVCLSPASQIFAQKEGAPLAFDTFFKEGMEKTEGILSVYRDGENIYLEIPQNLIGREIEIRAQINSGLDMIARPMQSLGVVRIEMGQKQDICFQQGIFAERVLDEKSELQRSFQASNKQPVDILYPIVAYAKNKEGYIIDITDVLKNGDNWFQMRYNHVRALDAKHSKVTGIHAFEEGVSFAIHQMYSCNPERENTTGAMTMLPSALMAAEIGCVIQLLPAQDMRLRLASDKVGFKTIGFRDFSQNPYGVVRDSIIMRWKLSIAEADLAAYRKGEPVEPVHPIVFHIDPYLPKEYIPAIKKAVTAWNKAFQRAGYKNAIQVKVADKETRMEEQKAVIAYDLIEPGIKSSFTVHPRTGEILSCRINIGHGFIPGKLTSYLLQCGATDERIVKDRWNKDIANNIMASALMRSIGEILALCPNYAGSAAYTTAEIKDAKRVSRQGYTASIMDENPYHYAALPKDRIAPENLMPCVGEYDCWAIGWAYREFPKNKDCYADRESLKPYLTTADTPEHRYAPSSTDIRSGKGDLAQEGTDAIRQGLENLLYLFEHIEQVVYNGPITDRGNAIKNFSQDALNMYCHYLNLTATCFGSALPLEKQKEAMDILSHYFFTGTLPADAKIIRENQLADFSETIARNGRNIFVKIFSKELMEQLIKAEKAGSDNYTVHTFFEDLYQAMFANFDTQVPFTYRQMDILVAGIGTWLEITNENKIFDNQDIASFMLANEMQYVYNQLKQLAKNHTDKQSRSICKVLAHRMAQKLNNKNK